MLEDGFKPAGRRTEDGLAAAPERPQDFPRRPHRFEDSPGQSVGQSWCVEAPADNSRREPKSPTLPPPGNLRPLLRTPVRPPRITPRTSPGTFLDPLGDARRFHQIFPQGREAHEHPKRFQGGYNFPKMHVSLMRNVQC